MNVFRFGAVRSPPRRPTVQSSEQSPFCTSPSQLQDVTLDPSLAATIPFAHCSPDRTSPIRGRTMKEYEEQLSHLQKENFNLKLRIYFLEERMDHMRGTDDKEKLVKENIELKVKLETLRKELTDKQELVCQAAKAVQLMEEQHQAKLKQLQQDFMEQKDASEKHIRDLEEQLEKLLEVYKEQNFLKLNNSSNEAASEQLREQKKCIDKLLDKKHQLECNLQEQAEHANHLEVELQEAHRESKHANKLYEDLKVEIQERDSQLRELRMELELKNNSITELRQKILSAEQSLFSKEEKIKAHTNEIVERDGILEQKNNQIKELEKSLAKLQISLDEKERQFEELRSSLTARDSVIVSLESKYASAKANVRNMESELESSRQDVQRLQEEINTMKNQLQSGKLKYRDNPSGDGLIPAPTKNKWYYCVDNRGSQKKTEASQEKFIEIPVSELQKIKDKLISAEETEKKLHTRLEISEKSIKAEKARIAELESHINDLSQRLKDTQQKCRQADEKIVKLENSCRTACQTIQESVRRGKELKKENEQLKEAEKRRKIEKQQILEKLTEAYKKAKSEQKRKSEDPNLKTGAQGEQEAQGVLPCCVPVCESGDTLLAEIDMMSQFLLKTINEKEELIDCFERKLSTAIQDIKSRDAQILKLEEEICELRNCVTVLQHPPSKELRGVSQEGSRAVSRSVSDLVNTVESKMHNMLLTEVQDKNREIERLNAELRKRTTNLQELVNKELWDKNREIEKLQDRLNIMCERKDLQIRTVNQQLATKDLQLKTLQDKIVEFLTRAGIPPTLILKDLQTVVHTQNEEESAPETTKEASKHFNGLSSAFMDGSPNLQCNLLATMEENKYLSQKVEELQERIRNTPERDNESRVVQNLRLECSRFKEQLELSEKSYRDAREAITLLTRRLEELALFLSSLLQNRELLRGISIQRHRVLKQAVENSIELSRRFSISFASVQSVNECSNFMQLSSLSDLLNFSGSSFNLTEFLKEKIKQANVTAIDVIPPDNKFCVSDLDSLESKSISLSKFQETEVLADVQEEKELNGIPSTDLISFSPVETKSNDNCDETSLSSMTFYNSCHVINETSLECPKINNDNIPYLPESSQGHQGLLNSENHKAVGIKNTKSIMSSVYNNTNKAGANQNLSDSEAWSEPDRNVSMERIGLQEEHGKSACGSGAVVRTRNSRVQDSDNSSESSEDTAQEDLRVPVARRARFEYGEIKRLQNKLHALEQMNEALKKELDILHHLKDQFHVLKDCSANTSQHSVVQEDKTNTNIESSKGDGNTVTISLCLLEEIKNQREKLESSLLHNDLIRKQLETVILNMPDSEVCDAHGLWEKLKETTEDFDEAQNKVQQLEKDLTAAKEKLLESQQRIKFLETSNNKFQANINISDMEKQIYILRSTLQERDNEILEKQCLVLELENKSKEQSIENEKKQHFDKVMLEDLQKRLADSEGLRHKVEKQILELEQKKREAELRAMQAELEKEEIRNVLEQEKTKYEHEICEAQEKLIAAESKLNEVTTQLKAAELKLTDLVQQLQVSQAAIKKKEGELREMEQTLQVKEKQLVERDWVYKTELERKSAEIEKQKLLGEKMQSQIKDLENKEINLKQELDKKLEILEENYKTGEASLREELKELTQLLKEKENEFHHQLDDAAVMASGLTLERTKLVNEKLRLEQDLRRLELRLSDVERNRLEMEKQLKAANIQLEEKVEKLEKENRVLQKSAQELESYNAELEKNLAGMKERVKHYTNSMSSGHVPGIQEKSIAHKVDLLSSPSLPSALDVFTGDGGSLPGNFWTLPTKLIENVKDRPNRSGVHGHVLARQYSDVSDCMSEELTSDEYKVMVRRAGRQYSVPCDQHLVDLSHHSVESLDTRNTASSPDLGIESDQGRFSSLEAVPVQRPLIQLETTQYVENREGKLENVSALVLTTRSECEDFIQLKQENAELKRRLVQTRKALEKTVEQLVSANQRKKQVEKAICKQLHKTHTILKQSRVNLQNDPTVESCTDECE